MYKPSSHLKAVLLTGITTLTIILFIGCFANPPANMDESFSGKYWYYINRGYPTAFTGWTLQGTTVTLPHVKLPFIVPQGEPTRFEKIIDVTKLAPLFFFTFLILYIPAYIFVKAAEKNKKLFPFLVLANIAIFAIGLFIYFSWLTRI